MQRSKNKDPRPLWKKLGGGTMGFKGRDIKSGETFRAYKQEIPERFMDLLQLVRDGDKQMQEKEPEPKQNLRIESVGGGWYNVVNAETGNPVNDKKLRKQEAEELAGQVQTQETQATDETEEGNRNE